jgi:SRSO17 transposase
MNADQVRSLQPALAALLESFRGCFAKEPVFEHLQTYVLGLLTDLKRKSVEPIALAAGVPVRTLQEFLSQLTWDHQRGRSMLQRLVMDRHGCDNGIGVIDASAHAKQGKKTPGVQRQWCGESGKVDNCVVGQHLLYTDNDPKNPFSCTLASDLYLPEGWASDRPRCEEAKIPNEVTYRPKWRIAIDQVQEAVGNGVRFSWLTFDEDYGSVPEFWFELDRLGQRGIGEVRSNFLVWPRLPRYQSTQAAHAAKRVDNVCRFSPAFREQGWVSAEGQKHHAWPGGVGVESVARTPGGYARRGVASDGSAVLVVGDSQRQERRSQVSDQQRRGRRELEADDACDVCALARGKMVRARQAGSGLRGVRGAALHRVDAPLVLRYGGDVLLGCPNAAVAGGKTYGSRWSRWPKPPMAWRRRCGTAGGTRGLN